jgi:hypothetical protein
VTGSELAAGQGAGWYREGNVSHRSPTLRNCPRLSRGTNVPEDGQACCLIAAARLTECDYRVVDLQCSRQDTTANRAPMPPATRSGQKFTLCSGGCLLHIQTSSTLRAHRDQ